MTAGEFDDMNAGDDLLEAIRQSWSARTSATPADWSPSNPATAQCDASSCVGSTSAANSFSLVGEQTGHHYRNRVDGVDFDVTVDQFTGVEEIREIAVLDGDTIRERRQVAFWSGPGLLERSVSRPERRCERSGPGLDCWSVPFPDRNHEGGGADLEVGLLAPDRIGLVHAVSGRLTAAARQ